MSSLPRCLSRQTVDRVDQTVRLLGWVNNKRDHGKITFIDLRDRSGIVQCVGYQKMQELKAESVVEIIGTVKQRPANMVNPSLETGTVEVDVTEYQVIAQAEEVPFPLDTDGLDIDERLRLKYRYLDLRRARMTNIIRFRSQMIQFIRQWLIKQEFVEIETPILTKSTPEGARDFLVPSRLQKGKFYALPQSPQQYKQLLMVAGFERYFQIARCFRDEDPRSDRAYGEFTQLDMEMSFVTQDDILQLVEEMFTQMVQQLLPDKHFTATPWPRIRYPEAMKKYGTDRPDIRKNPQDPHELGFAWIVDFPLFTSQTEEDFFHGSGNAKFAPSHHMFTAPHPEDIHLLDTAPEKIRGLQHDLVLNGAEVGGGSIRIHDPQIQSKIFDLIGFTAQQKIEFEHMLTAFNYGVPPHGGIAPGIDRLLMMLFNQPSVRETIAFPAMSSGHVAVMDAPSQVTKAQLAELGICICSNDH